MNRLGNETVSGRQSTADERVLVVAPTGRDANIVINVLMAEKGAEFIVQLPRVQPIEHPEHGSERKNLPPVPQRVLVVDDNSDLAETVAVLLRDDGHVVRVANDGLSALPIAEEFKPNAAVLDIGLPGLKGYELARELRSRQNARRLLLIATTGYGQPEDRERAQAAGFDCHLVKPLDAHALSTVLAEWATKPLGGQTSYISALNSRRQITGHILTNFESRLLKRLPC